VATGCSQAQPVTTAVPAAPPGAPVLVLQQAPSTFLTGLDWCQATGLLAGSSEDGTVRIWDSATGDLEQNFRADADNTNAVAFSPDGTRLATGGGINATHDDPDGPGEAEIWDPVTGQKLLMLPKFPHPVSSVLFTPGGQSLITLSYVDKPTNPGAQTDWDPGDRPGIEQLQFWNAATGALSHTWAFPDFAVGGIHFSPDGKMLALSALVKTPDPAPRKDGTLGAMYQGINSEIRIYDAGTLALVRTLTYPAAEIRGFAWSPDSRIIAAGYSVDAGDNLDNDPIRLWDAATGQVTGLLTSKLRMDWGDAEAMAFSPDGKSLAVGKFSMGSFIQIWDVPNRKLTSRLADAPEDQILNLVLSRDGTTLVAGGGDFFHGALQFWNLTTRHLDRRIAAPSTRFLDLVTGPGNTVGMQFSQFPRSLMRGGAEINDVKFWDLATGRLRTSVSLGSSMLSAIAVSPAKNQLIFGADNFPGAGNKPSVYNGYLHIADIGTGRTLKVITLQQVPNSVAVSPDGRAVLTADGLAHLWDSVSGRPLADLASCNAYPEYALFSPDDQLVAGLGDREGEMDLAVWNRSKGNLLWENEQPNLAASAFAFTSDSQSVVTGHIDGLVRVWSTKTGHLSWTLKGHLGAVTAVAVRPSPSAGVSASPAQVATASLDGTVRVWNPATGTLLAVITDSEAVVKLAYSADDTKLVTLDEDGLLRIWGADDFQLRATAQVLSVTPSPQGGVTTDWVTTTPDGYYDCSPGAADYIRWRVNGQLLPASAEEATYHRPDLVAKALRR